MLIIVCGLQGTGKTTVAKKIAERLNAVLLRTDVIRKELTSKPSYTEEEKQKVYNEMFFRARELLKKKRRVVLDATFRKKENRRYAESVAKELSVAFKLVVVECSEKITRERIKNRRRDESDARLEDYLRFKSSFDPIKRNHIIVDNSRNLEYIDKQLGRHF